MNGQQSATSVLGSTGQIIHVRPAGTISAREIEEAQYPPLQWVIPDILPEGLAIIAAPPKAGKSYLALDTALAVAGSGRAFGGIRCETGDVLYLALEDGCRRLQSRMRQLRPDGDIPARLYFRTEAERISGGLVDKLEDWIEAVERPRLIVIDTWRAVKPEATGRGSAYDEDASGIAPIHELTKRHPGLCVLVVHHTRKTEADDTFANVSGSYGLTGVADTLLVLARHGEGHKLCVRGREVEDAEKELQRERETGGWKIMGDARELAKTSERQEILDLLPEAGDEALRTAQIATEIGKDRKAVSYLLKKLRDEGRAESPAYGKWKLSNTPTNYTKSTNWMDGEREESQDFADFADFAGDSGHD